MQLSSGMVYLLLFIVSSCIQISVIKLVVNRAIYFTMLFSKRFVDDLCECMYYQ